jgi:hypothetical protein
MAVCDQDEQRTSRERVPQEQAVRRTCWRRHSLYLSRRSARAVLRVGRKKYRGLRTIGALGNRTRRNQRATSARSCDESSVIRSLSIARWMQNALNHRTGRKRSGGEARTLTRDAPRLGTPVTTRGRRRDCGVRIAPVDEQWPCEALRFSREACRAKGSEASDYKSA